MECNVMIDKLLGLGNDLVELLYPVSCLVCGDRLSDESYLCGYCGDYAFESSNIDGNEASEGIVLPDWITMQDALWEFDKGGFLQDILHHVKYSGLANLGVTLGEKLGYKLLKNPFMRITDETVLLPVPLHPSRQRRRGYNQSALIASGVVGVTGAHIAEEGAMKRVSNTRTQTGLNARSRRENLAGAFLLADSEAFRDRAVIIVDDVITTGATAIELAGQIKELVKEIGIATIARA